jgi:aspartyl-tRNA(Asn)/glutamyl-tRNA(Gln) amidotransferase subunit A
LQERRDEYGAQTLARLLPGLLHPATRYVEALTLRQKVLAGFREAVFAKADVLHTPTMPMPAPTLAESDVRDRAGFMDYLAPFGHCTRPASYLGLPAISVPAGLTTRGLPCAFQLIGRPDDELTLLTFAHCYERATEAQRVPPIGAEKVDAR